MAKRVVLKLDGNLEHQGFRVTLEITDTGKLLAEETGYLPPAPALLECLEQWQHHYQQLSGLTRIVLKKITVQSGLLSHGEQVEVCRELSRILETHLKTWLSSDSFTMVDRRLREVLSLDEPIQVVVRSPDPRLHHFPWHTWDFVERYQKAEVALGAPASKPEQSRRSSTLGRNVRILAILGDRNGIDVEADRLLLSTLPNTTLEFLVEPSRQEIHQQLWDQPWDILFFAGHSRTEAGRGRIYINAQDSLTLEELKFGLRQAIAQGLQLAVFNSCDGLGLAYEMEQLHIPQLIVMREPVPDVIAQEFLKHFLTAYSRGNSLYLSVRQARERLQAWEGDFPCASWLPVLYQNPAESPPTWQELLDQRDPISIQSMSHRFRKARRLTFPQVGLISLVVMLFLVGVRATGVLELLELTIFDQMMRLRPAEDPDPRILIIEITDADIAAQQQRGEVMQRISTSSQTEGQTFNVSLSDESLYQLLQVLLPHQPRVIGLDIYRDFAVQPVQPELAQLLQQAPIIGVCKAEDLQDAEIPSIDPPLEIPLDRIGFSDFQTDADGKLRRHLLSMYPRLWSPESRCTANHAFSTQIAFQYLKQEGISATFTATHDLQLGSHVFKALNTNPGGYQKLIAGGGGVQLLLNYRTILEVAERISLSDLFSHQINPAYIQDKIVLIGINQREQSDRWNTLYGEDTSGVLMPGVIVQAHMISQLLSAALDHRPLLWVWNSWLEGLWILSWSYIGGKTIGMIVSGYSSVKQTLIWVVSGIFVISGILYGLCYVILLLGGWVPLVPALLASGVSGGTVAIVCWFQHSRSARKAL